MITNLQRLGVDTTTETRMTLTYSDDVRKNYQSLFRLLRRLTTNYTFQRPEFVRLLSYLNRWESVLSLSGKYSTLNNFDRETIKKSVGFTDKMTEEQIVANPTSVVILYNGTAFRNQHIWYGSFRRPVALSNGTNIKNVLFISKPAAILLNWSSKSKKQEDFNILASYITNKMSQRFTLVYKEDLSRIFHKFYTDYLAEYSVTLQEREYAAMREGSIATAYRTKKNIPDYIQARMNETSLLQLFDFVELDETVDLDRFDEFERDVLRLRATFPELFPFKVSSLRLRKLGKHSSANKTTTGLYYPSFDNIVVELRNVRSFVHEWGHAFDNKKGVLSGKKEFLDDIYAPAVSYIARHVEDKQFQSYYSMPSEVFARAFEWYVHHKYNEDSGILKDNHEYEQKPEYVCFNTVASDIIRYFESVTR